MAEKVTLRDYQKGILEKLDVIKATQSSGASNYLGVELNGKNVLVNMQDITETLALTEIQSVPLVKPWFLGMSNVRGVLYAINDLGQILDGQATEFTSDTRMLLLSDSVVSNVGFVVERLIGLRNPDIFKRIDNTEENNLCFSDDCYEDESKNVWYMLDTALLISSSEFEIPYAV